MGLYQPDQVRNGASGSSSDLQRLAKLLLADTRTPQDGEHRARYQQELPDPERHQELTGTLQRLLQDPERCSDLARQSGVGLAVYSKGPVDGTPTGDFFEVIPLPDGRLSLFLGDAVGHDSQEAWDNSVRFNLFTSSPTFQKEAYRDGYSASDVLCYLDVNCNFRGGSARDAVVASHVLLDPKTGEFEFANAGNPHHLTILRADGTVDRLLATGGWLGNPEIFQYADHDYTQETGFLSPGDIAVLMSDGIPDGVHVSGEPMNDQLPQIMNQLSGQKLSPQEVVEHVLNELESTPDDLSIMAFGI